MSVLPYITYTEAMVGDDHPTLADTLNRALRQVLTDSGLDPDASFPGFLVTSAVGLVSRLGVGAAAPADTGLHVVPDVTGVTQNGLGVAMIGDSGATTAAIGIGASAGTAAAAFTAAEVIGIRVFDATKGAASTITTQVGLDIKAQTKGASNYAIRTAGGDVLHTLSAGQAWTVLTAAGGGSLGFTAGAPAQLTLANCALILDASSPIDVDAGLGYRVAGDQVVGPRILGWGFPTGAETRTTFDPASVTLSQLAERVAALLNDLRLHGLINDV